MATWAQAREELRRAWERVWVWCRDAVLMFPPESPQFVPPMHDCGHRSWGSAKDVTTGRTSCLVCYNLRWK